MPNKIHHDLPPSLGPTALPPYITHSHLILHPKTKSVRYWIETALTLTIWGGLLYLLATYIIAAQIETDELLLEQAGDFLFNLGLIALIYLLLLIVNLAVMSLWAMVNKHRALKKARLPNTSELQHQTTVRTPQASGAMLACLAENNIVTIFHNENGQIENICAGYEGQTTMHASLDNSSDDGGPPPQETFMSTLRNTQLSWHVSDDSVKMANS